MTPWTRHSKKLPVHPQGSFIPSALAVETPTASMKANDAATTRLLFFTTYLPVVCAARV